MTSCRWRHGLWISQASRPDTNVVKAWVVMFSKCPRLQHTSLCWTRRDFDLSLCQHLCTCCTKTVFGHSRWPLAYYMWPMDFIDLFVNDCMIDWLYVYMFMCTLCMAHCFLFLLVWFLILCLYDLISRGCNCLFRHSCIFFYIFKIIFITFFVFFRSYSSLFAVLWWPVQWAFVAFLVTWNKYDFRPIDNGRDREDDQTRSGGIVLRMTWKV